MNQNGQNNQHVNWGTNNLVALPGITLKKGRFLRQKAGKTDKNRLESREVSDTIFFADGITLAALKSFADKIAFSELSSKREIV